MQGPQRWDLISGSEHIGAGKMTQDWNWQDDDAKELIVIQPTEATAIYANPSLDIVIRQTNAITDEDSVIIIPRDRVRDVIDALERELKSAEEESSAR